MGGFDSGESAMDHKEDDISAGLDSEMSLPCSRGVGKVPTLVSMSLLEVYVEDIHFGVNEYWKLLCSLGQTRLEFES